MNSFGALVMDLILMTSFCFPFSSDRVDTVRKLWLRDMTIGRSLHGIPSRY
jgi:hypothetical protein